MKSVVLVNNKHKQKQMSPSPLEIKINAVARLAKEQSLYQKEFEDQKTVVEKLESDTNADIYELKTQRQILEETTKIVSVIKGKLEERLRMLKEEFVQEPVEELREKYEAALALAESK